LRADIFSPFMNNLDKRTELRAQTNLNRTIILSSGNIITNQRSEESGVFSRVWEKGAFGACSAPGFEKESIELVLKTAEKNAKILSANKKDYRPLPDTPKGSVDPKTSFNDLDQKVLLDYARSVDELIVSKYKNIVSRRVRISVDCTETLLAVTNGCNSHRILPRAHIFISLTALDNNGLPVELTNSFGGGGNFSDHFTNPENLNERLDKLYSHIMNKREGIFPEAGIADIVLSAKLAGILAHEAVGHTTESDLVRGGSVAGPYRNQQVATEKVTMVDFAHTAFGKEAPLPIYVDDEGTTAEDVTIIKDGVLLDYMTNLQDSPYVNSTPKGNGRAYSYSDEPLVRMRNTCIMPGDDNLDAMISSVENGYYLIDYSNGQADSTSEFMFGINMGYEIKNGKLGRAIKDTTISGVAFDILKTIDMVGKDIIWSASGHCGKKTPLGTAMGGPDIKCRLQIGGR